MKSPTAVSLILPVWLSKVSSKNARPSGVDASTPNSSLYALERLLRPNEANVVSSSTPGLTAGASSTATASVGGASSTATSSTTGAVLTFRPRLTGGASSATIGAVSATTGACAAASASAAALSSARACASRCLRSSSPLASSLLHESFNFVSRVGRSFTGLASLTSLTVLSILLNSWYLLYEPDAVPDIPPIPVPTASPLQPASQISRLASSVSVGSPA